MAVVYVASPAAAMMTGSSLMLDGGMDGAISGKLS